MDIGTTIRIEPQWNVNADYEKTFGYPACIRIEPQWNVNFVRAWGLSNFNKLEQNHSGM